MGNQICGKRWPGEERVVLYWNNRQVLEITIPKSLIRIVEKIITWFCLKNILGL